MANDRASTILEIIDKRRTIVDDIDQVQDNLTSLATTLQDLEALRHKIIPLADPEIRGRLEDLDLVVLKSKIDEQNQGLTKLKSRFARNTLNIGVVGRARQGKSRLLQSLSGLSATEIPDGSRLHCTGVRSTIYHNPSVPPYGEVAFYSQRAFLDEVVAPYYRELGLGVPPLSIDYFATTALPELPKNLPGRAEPRAKYEHLKGYHNSIDEYSGLLAATAPKKIGLPQIREYVAQDTAGGQRIFHNYLAVREVKIVCKFPKENVGQIALIDMPGLGDTGIGEQERLMKTLGEDVDVVLFVRMPKASGDYWADVDVQLYDLAHQALTALPINRWSFMILNQTSSSSPNGDNSDNCYDLARTLHETHIDVIESITVDCSDAESTGEQVLDKVLDYLSTNITQLDQEYASSHQDRLITLPGEVEVELKKAQAALGQAPTFGGEQGLFTQLFNSLWNDLASALLSLVRELKKESGNPDATLKQAVRKAVEAWRQDSGVPSLEQIEIRRDATGSYGQAYHSYLDEIRTRISHHFFSLDDALKRSVQNAKNKVGQILLKEGRLQQWAETTSENSLQTLAAQIPAELPQLKEAFQILAEFELSYRGFIHYRVRPLLKPLIPDETEWKLAGPPSAKQMLEYLEVIPEETLYQVESAFDGWMAEPNQVVFTIIEEFVDQVLRTEGAKDNWRHFYFEMRAEVWSSEFGRFGEQSRIRRQWKSGVDKAIKANQADFFRFLNP